MIDRIYIDGYKSLREVEIAELGPLTVLFGAEVSDLEARDPGPNGERLASFYFWLERTHPGRFRNLEANLQRLVPGFRSIDVREAADGFLELWVEEEQRGAFPASLLSEGTLRLLCLLGILASPSPPFLVGYEEPENGVHPARLGEMLDMISRGAGHRGQQFLLTTHSVEVLDHLAEHPRIRCQRRGDRTAFTPASDLPLFQREHHAQALGAQVSTLGQQVLRGDLG